MPVTFYHFKLLGDSPTCTLFSVFLSSLDKYVFLPSSFNKMIGFALFGENIHLFKDSFGLCLVP